MTAPLTALECELLEAVATSRDEAAMSVLADYWIQNVDVERGSFVQLHVGENAGRLDLADEEMRLGQFARQWRDPAIVAGYPEDRLTLVDGFLQWPLCVRAGDPLDGHPDIVRISPRYHREVQCLRVGVDCTVFEGQAVTPRTLERVAIKCANHAEALELIDHELALLRMVDHENVVRAHGYTIRPEGRALVLAWSGCDLRKLIGLARTHDRALGIDFAIGVGVQILDALIAIGDAGIVHGEARSEHITVATDGLVRLIDFGFARHPSRRRPRLDQYISPGIRRDNRYRFRYMAPEQCRGLELTARSDVFTACEVICELVTNTHPVPDLGNDLAVLQHIVTTDLPVPAELPVQLRMPLQWAFARDPRDRITARELRETLVAGARLLRMDISRELVARRLLELGVPT